jgi:hypothetical protein
VVLVVVSCDVVVAGLVVAALVVVLVCVAVVVVLVADDVAVVALEAVVAVCGPESAAVAAAAEPSTWRGIAVAITMAIVVAVGRGISIWCQKTCAGKQTFPD